MSRLIWHHRHVTTTDRVPMLETVRLARGHTQTRLAELSAISQATISKLESGALEVDRARAEKLAGPLDAPVDLLGQPRSILGQPSVIFHRKRSSLAVSAMNRLRTQLDLLHLQVHSLLEDGPAVELRRDPVSDDGYVTPEEVAYRTRRALRLPSGPVENVVDALEAAGVAIVRRDLGSPKIDALMSWPRDGRPVVLLASHAPGDRQRFSLAHELGHAVMHELPSEFQEQEADRFASEFLMPRTDLAGSLRGVTLTRLTRLKQQWRVSMAALLRRARDLGEISDSEYRTLNIEISQAGYRKAEPIEVPSEPPHLLTHRVEQLLAEGRSVDDLASRAWMTTNEFTQTYQQGSNDD